ncbi:MAG TPA: heme biosynthesis HemY N-terminal domain-containing protein [Accumulibacter sp.]|nr:heme biosynthesis HemY N-terminal domain-containing protein [Accumulibacter sp.]HQC78897.1 heme biosynthesis HemY N-terminal domain-containing protein [Accumulibacter sp.]
MKALLWLLALFVLAVALSLAARFNEGYLLLVLPPYRAEVSLNLALVVLVAAFALLYAVLRTLSLTASLPRQAREFRRRQRREAAVDALHDAVRLFFEGRFGRVLKNAAPAEEAGQAPELAALLVTHAARRLYLPPSGESRRWRREPRECADDATARWHAAGLMLEAGRLVDQQRFDDALDTLSRFRAVAGRRVAARYLELRALQGSGNWPEVLRLARLLERHRHLLPAVARNVKYQAHREILRRRRSERGDGPVTQDAMHEIWACWLPYLRGMPVAERDFRLLRDACDALRTPATTAGDGLDDFPNDKPSDAQSNIPWEAALQRIGGRLHEGASRSP